MCTENGSTLQLQGLRAQPVNAEHSLLSTVTNAHHSPNQPQDIYILPKAFSSSFVHELLHLLENWAFNLGDIS